MKWEAKHTDEFAKLVEDYYRSAPGVPTMDDRRDAMTAAVADMRAKYPALDCPCDVGDVGWTKLFLSRLERMYNRVRLEREPKHATAVYEMDEIDEVDAGEQDRRLLVMGYTLQELKDVSAISRK